VHICCTCNVRVQQGVCCAVLCQLCFCILASVLQLQPLGGLGSSLCSKRQCLHIHMLLYTTCSVLAS
jgi:hypothetical protein